MCEQCGTYVGDWRCSWCGATGSGEQAIFDHAHFHQEFLTKQHQQHPKLAKMISELLRGGIPFEAVHDE